MIPAALSDAVLIVRQDLLSRSIRERVVQAWIDRLPSCTHVRLNYRPCAPTRATRQQQCQDQP